MTETLISTHVTASQVNELPALRIHNKVASSTISIQGAQVIEYALVDKPNLFFVSQAEPYAIGKAIRGGVPICWPWFGPHASEKEAPAHGLVRAELWQYEVVSDTEQRTELRFWYETSGEDIGFSFKARAELLVSVGETLVMSLTTHNLGSEPFQLSQALHSYFKCDDVADVKIMGLHGQPYIDKVTKVKAYFPSTFQFNREIDWIVHDRGTPLALTGLGDYAIGMKRIGSGSVVVWNPWVDKAKTLSQFQPEEYQKMFCVEASNASEDTRLVKAGGEHVLIMELKHLSADEVS